MSAAPAENFPATGGSAFGRQSLENAAPQTSNHWKLSPALLAAVVIAISILPYLFSVRFPFVYDDWGAIAENPFLRQPDALAKVLTLQTFFEPRILDGERPLVIFSCLLDKSIWGLNPFGFHLTNIFLHAAAVAFLFALLGALAAPLRLRAAACLLFGLHPALTEAVQVPAFREDLLATVFTLAFLFFAQRKDFIIALVSLFLALCGKEAAIIAPALLAWLWLCFPSTVLRHPSSLRFLAASAALVALYLAVTFTHRPFQSAGEIWNGLALRWPQNISTSPWLFARTLGTLAFPYPLCADYIVTPVTFSDEKFFYGVYFIGASAAFALSFRRRQPMFAFAAGWLLISFIPVSNVIPLFNPLADRYLYMPAIAFAILFGSLIHAGRKETTDHTDSTDAKPDSQSVPSVKSVVGLSALSAILALLCACYIGLTLHRLADWNGDEKLWTATAKAEPRSARAQTWLGLLAANRGDLAQARKYYERANELNPQDVRGLINLAILDGKAGHVALAEKKLRAATERRPDFAEGWWNLSFALHLLGRDAEAGQAASRAAKLDPFDPRARPSGRE